MATPKIELQSFVIGHEIDAHFDFQTSQMTTQLSAAWQQNNEVFENQRTFPPSLRSTLKVVIIGKFNGLTNASLQSCFTQVFTNADFVSVTYYPMDSGFKLKTTSVVLDDFAKIVQMHPGNESYFQEIGYTNGPALAGLSETQQSQF